MTEVIAFSYAALQPSKGLLEKYLGEILKLEKKGTITARDHQLLRSSGEAQRELMNLTLGEEDALTDQTVTETLARVTAEIKKEENEKYQTEQASHCKTQQELASERTKNQTVQSRLFWRCTKNAKRCSWGIAILIGFIFVIGVIAGLGITTSNKVLGWILTGAFGLVTLAGVVDLLLDCSVRVMRGKLEKYLLTWMLRREESRTGLILGRANDLHRQS